MKKWVGIMASLSGAALLLAASLCLPGCANLAYYWQSVTGHLQVINAAKPVQDWLDDSKTPDATKRRLELAQRIRTFASQELGLPDNASYRRYADLQRLAVVYNVVAAPEFSLQLKTWCFAVAGCVGYRGYYSEQDAKQEASALKALGLEVNVYGVPAYSTLGYLNWAGGDPLLSTFIHYPEGELARMVFHELAHQVLYVKDDTMFNESFATAVERIGGQRWLDSHASQAAREQYAQFDERRKQFRALTLHTRAKLAAIYTKNTGSNHTDNAYVAINNIADKKVLVMQSMRDEYAQLKKSWGNYAGYDAWIANANNASLGALAAYDELVPQFEALFERSGKDWQKFYAACQSIVDLPKDERRQALAKLAGSAAQ
jgi:predicted aminopeptidase